MRGTSAVTHRLATWLYASTTPIPLYVSSSLQVYWRWIRTAICISSPLLSPPPLRAPASEALKNAARPPRETRQKVGILVPTPCPLLDRASLARRLLLGRGEGMGGGRVWAAPAPPAHPSLLAAIESRVAMRKESPSREASAATPPRLRKRATPPPPPPPTRPYGAFGGLIEFGAVPPCCRVFPGFAELIKVSPAFGLQAASRDAYPRVLLLKDPGLFRNTVSDPIQSPILRGIRALRWHSRREIGFWYRTESNTAQEEVGSPPVRRHGRADN